MALDNEGEDTGDPVELEVPIGVGLFSTGFKLTFGMELLDDMVLVLGAEVVVDFMVGLKGGGFEVVALGLDVGVVFVVGFGCEIFGLFVFGLDWFGFFAAVCVRPPFKTF